MEVREHFDLTPIALFLVNIPWMAMALPPWLTNPPTIAPNGSEQYKLCTSTATIALQKQFNLTQVSSVPPKAALMPSWLETLIGMIVCIWPFLRPLLGQTSSITGLVFIWIVILGVSICLTHFLYTYPIQQDYRRLDLCFDFDNTSHDGSHPLYSGGTGGQL